MNSIKEQWVRVLYTAISIIAIFIAIKFKEKVLADPLAFNDFSYFGVVATLIALLISLSEVFHSINISKGILHEAKRLLKESQATNGASFVSECLSVLDEVNDHISGERYGFSLKCFQHFRRTYLRISGSGEQIKQADILISKVELSLQRATHTTPNAPLPKKKRMEIQESVLNIKEIIEELNPAKRGSYVSA